MNTLSGHPLRLAIAAGGTGGHVMPALALAEALRAECPDIELLALCGERPQEREWYRAAGFAPHCLPAAPLAPGIAGKLKAIAGAGRAFLQARRILREWNARGVVGMGGYVSGPCVLAGARLGLPTVIHEQNSIPGKTNRWLAGRATVAATTYPGAFDAISTRRVAVTGNPLRKAALDGAPQDQARQHFNLDPRVPTALISGGSQGAQRLNAAVLDMAAAGDGPRPGFQSLWITGAKHYPEVERQLAARASGAAVKAVSFEGRMGLAYAAADIAVCRAGSASLAEAAAWGLPMIAVPYPHAADDHQRRNAEFYRRAGACVVIEDADLTGAGLREAIDSILGDPERRRRMNAAAKGLAQPDAAAKLARLTLETIGA